MQSSMRTSMIDSMRATVTIDNDLFSEADRQADAMGLSRSGFYQEALRVYLRRIRDARLTEQMNGFLERQGEPENTGLERLVAQAWSRDMGDDDW